MTEHSLWRFSRAFHRAINERQFSEVETLIDEEVDWAIHGPVELFHGFGARRGRSAVMEVIRQIAERVRVHRLEREQIMLGADQASSMLNYTLTATKTNKPLRLRLAHFARFKEGRLSSIRILVDAFDLTGPVANRSPRMGALGVGMA